MSENEFKGTTSSEDSDADMAECSNGFDEATHDQGKIFNPFSIAEVNRGYFYYGQSRRFNRYLIFNR